PPRSTHFPYTTLFRSPEGIDLTVRADIHRAKIDSSWHRDWIHPTLAAVGGAAEEHIRIVVGEVGERAPCLVQIAAAYAGGVIHRSEEHTSELQSRVDL